MPAAGHAGRGRRPRSTPPRPGCARPCPRPGDLPRARPRSGPADGVTLPAVFAHRGRRSATTPGARRPPSRSCSGIEPDGRPAAELWFGAHPDDPSRVRRTATRLDALIAARPGGAARGRRRSSAFGAAAAVPARRCWPPTSRCRSRCIPTCEQARAGFAAEEAAGVAARRARAQLPRPQPQAGAALRADRVRGPVRVPAGRATRCGCSTRSRCPSSTPVRGNAARPDDLLRAAFTALLDACADPAPLVAAVVAGCRRLAGDPDWALAAGRSLLAAPTSPATSASCWRCCSTTSGWSRARRSTWAPATCTPTCAAPASRSWPTATTCCAAG